MSTDPRTARAHLASTSAAQHGRGAKGLAGIALQRVYVRRVSRPPPPRCTDLCGRAGEGRATPTCVREHGGELLRRLRQFIDTDVATVDEGLASQLERVLARMVRACDAMPKPQARKRRERGLMLSLARPRPPVKRVARHRMKSNVVTQPCAAGIRRPRRWVRCCRRQSTPPGALPVISSLPCLPPRLCPRMCGG